MRRIGTIAAISTAIATATLLTPAVALAHPFHSGGAGIGAGLFHAFGGVDHLLAALAVGLLVSTRSSAVRWTFPLLFLAAMGAGWAAAPFAAALTAAGALVTGSVLLLGAAVVAGRALPAPAVLSLVAGAGLLHGAVHTHGVGGGATAGLGLLIGTAGLHAVGAATGFGLARAAGHRGRQLAGSAIATVGCVLLAGLL